MNAAGDNTALGVLGWMAAIGNTHQRLTAADFMGKLETALHVGQLHILSRQGKPVAWLIWRKPDAEVWTQLRHHLAHFSCRYCSACRLYLARLLDSAIWM